MGPMKQLFDLNKLPEETEMEEVTEACQARTMFAGLGNLPAGCGDAQDHGRSTFDMSGLEMRGTPAVPELCGTVRRREPEVSLQESAYARSWLHLIGSTSSHPGTVQMDIRQPPASAMQVGGSAEYRSSNSVLGILGTPTPLQISQASRDLPAANLRRSNRRPATRYSQSEINTLSSTKRRGRHGPKSKSSEFRGVTYYKRTRRWEAHIWHDNGQVYLGASSTKESAARAYDKAALMLTGPEAEINFKAEDYAEDIAMLGKLTKNQIVIYLRRESRGKRKQAFFPGVKGIRKNKAFQATYKHDPKKKSSQLLGVFGSEEDAAKAIYEEAVRRDNKSVAERIMDITRVREMPTSPGLQPARELECTCAQKDSSNSKTRPGPAAESKCPCAQKDPSTSRKRPAPESKRRSCAQKVRSTSNMPITRKRTPATCKKLKLSTFKRQEDGANLEAMILSEGVAGRFFGLQDSRSQQAPENNNGQTSMTLRGWPEPGSPATSHRPSTEKALVAPQPSELPSMLSQISCNSFMPSPTNAAFRPYNAHISTPLQQPPSVALSSTNLSNRDNEGSFPHDISQSWLAEATSPSWRYTAATFTSRYGYPKSSNSGKSTVGRPIAMRPWEGPVAVVADSSTDSSTTPVVNTSG